MHSEHSETREQPGGNGNWTAREALDRLPDADELDRRVRELVRERPLLSVAAAVAAGFVLGRLLSRI